MCIHVFTGSAAGDNAAESIRSTVAGQADKIQSGGSADDEGLLKRCEPLSEYFLFVCSLKNTSSLTVCSTFLQTLDLVYLFDDWIFCAGLHQPICTG